MRWGPRRGATSGGKHRVGAAGAIRTDTSAAPTSAATNETGSRDAPGLVGNEPAAVTPSVPPMRISGEGAWISRRASVSGFPRPNGCPCRLRPTMDGAPDLIITDASLLAGGTFQPRPGAVAVKDGRIVAVGTAASCGLAGSTTDVRSMPGRLSRPGSRTRTSIPRSADGTCSACTSTISGRSRPTWTPSPRTPAPTPASRGSPEGAGPCTCSPAAPRARRTWTASSPIARCS